MPIRRATSLDLLIMVATMIIWALAFIGMKVAVPETGPFWLSAYRAVLGLIVVMPIALWAGLKWPQDARQWGLMMVIVILNIVVPIILIGWAELTLNAGIAALLMGTGPFFALFVGNILTRDEHFTTIRLIAVLMGFSGIVAIVGVDVLSDVGRGHVLPQMALMLASLFYVIAGFTIRKVTLPPLSIAAVSLLLGTLVLVPLSIMMSGPMPINLSPPAFWWLLFTGLAGTGLGFIARYYLIQNIGYSVFSVGINMIPVFGVIASALILGEVIEWTTALALVLVVGGLFLARLGTSQRPSP